MAEFRKGDRVRWCRVDSDPSETEAQGTIVAVITSDADRPEFTMYDVEFDFGVVTLYGTQISPSDEQIEPKPSGAGGTTQDF